MTAAVGEALGRGATTVICASTGNTAASAAAYAARAGMVSRYVDAYRRYCWPVASVDDLRLAPFHLLASEGRVHTDKSHTWHMDTLATVCRADPELLVATSYKLVDVTEPAIQA